MCHECVASEAWKSDTLGSCDRSIWPANSPQSHLVSLWCAFGCEVGKPAKPPAARSVASTCYAKKHLSGTRFSKSLRLSHDGALAFNRSRVKRYVHCVNRSNTSRVRSEDDQRASTNMVSRLAKGVSEICTDNDHLKKKTTTKLTQQLRNRSKWARPGRNSSQPRMPCGDAKWRSRIFRDIASVNGARGPREPCKAFVF